MCIPPRGRPFWDDLLISVTTFFRDPRAWDALQARAIAPLVDRADADEQIRAWVPGCATGEEAYSTAILFHEEFARRGLDPNFLIFASDVDEGALALAREGLYPHAISADLSDVRLDRYFVRDDDHYRVATELRDRLVFASHSVFRDPPFSRLHLVSCRNLLIYLDRDLQEQMMGVFRYACRDNGFLFLGVSETADEELFTPVDRKHRVFAARPRPEGTRPMLPDVLAAPAGRLLRYGREGRPGTKSSPTEVHVAALEAVAPPSVVVDERGSVLHLSPTTSRFLQQGGGALARRLTDLVRPELRIAHRAAARLRGSGAAALVVHLRGIQWRVASHRGARAAAGAR